MNHEQNLDTEGYTTLKIPHKDNNLPQQQKKLKKEKKTHGKQQLPKTNFGNMEGKKTHIS